MKNLLPLVFSAVFATLGLSLALADAPNTRLTSTAPEKSELIEEGADSATYRCEGLAGYEIIFEQAHGRSWIDLVFDSETLDLQAATLAASPGNFPSKADDELRWRGYEMDGAFTPYAVLYKSRSLQDDGNSTETYIIIQTAQGASRVVGSSPASKGLPAAEALADKLCGQ